MHHVYIMYIYIDVDECDNVDIICLITDNRVS